MRDYPTLKKFLWAHIAVVWSCSAIAAQETFAHDLTSIPLGAIAVAMSLAFIGGLAFTTQKIAKPDTTVHSVPLEIFKDIVNSLAAGLAAFFLGSWCALPLFAQALLITVAGYGGSRFLEQVLTESFARVGALMNGPPK